MRKDIPKISPLVRELMPGATEEELQEATENLRAYLAVAYRIFRRLEAEKSGTNEDSDLDGV